MAQFSPLYWCVVFLYVWSFFLIVFSLLWWCGKRSYKV